MFDKSSQGGGVIAIGSIVSYIWFNYGEGAALAAHRTSSLGKTQAISDKLNDLDTNLSGPIAALAAAIAPLQGIGASLATLASIDTKLGTLATNLQSLNQPLTDVGTAICGQIGTPLTGIDQKLQFMATDWGSKIGRIDSTLHEQHEAEKTKEAEQAKGYFS